MTEPTEPRDPSGSPPSGAPGPTDRALRGTLHREVLILLGLSLGASAIWSMLAIVDRLTLQVRLSDQVVAMNTSVTPDRPWLDLAYQLARIGLDLVPVLLGLYLLAHVARPAAQPPTRLLGFDLRRPARDLIAGLGLAALIGIPGLGLYLVARALGLNTTIAAANLAEHWWTVPVLVLAALQNGILEEVLVVGYLLTRLDQAGWRWPAALAASALTRGAYHLYQGFGGFVGNVVMGVVFALVWRRTRRVMPLVIAHTLIDVVAFVGYSALKGHVSWL